MNYTALSLSQTPPLSVPLRFFVTAPLFLAAAAALLMLSGDVVGMGRWSPTMLALTHLVTLGFLGLCMVGAMQQLLPVLIGTPIRMPRLVSTTLHLGLSLGIVMLVLGMALSRSNFLQWGSALLLSGLLAFILLVAQCLLRTTSRHATVHAMALALLGLFVLAGIALWLLVLGHWQLPLAHPLTRLHIGWGALGWIGALLVGVAYQVVPMFQITPEYPVRLRRWLLPITGVLLLLWSALSLWSPTLADLLAYTLVVPPLLFALMTLRLQQQRRRRLADVTLNFWRLSMLALILSLLLWLLSQWWYWPQLELLVGVLFLLGFATSAVNGMLYKIVPFLVWLHLNNRLQAQGSWQGSVPNMKQIIPVVATRRQFTLHLSALLSLVLVLLFPAVVPAWLSACLWLGSSVMLWWNLLQALQVYRRTLAEAQA